MKLEAKCSQCSAPCTVEMEEKIYRRESTRAALLKYAVCPSCTEAEKAEEARKEQEEKSRRNAAAYPQRYEESNIAKYFLPFDRSHPQANVPLLEFVWQNRRKSLLLRSDSGAGKTRVLTSVAGEMCREMTVYYTTAPDLTDELAAAFTRKERYGCELMSQIMKRDLLVIDDLGKESMSESRLMRLWQIIDARYTAHIQYRMGACIPEKSRRGHLVWIATNWTAQELISKFGRANGEPVIRRLVEICEIKNF